MHTVLIADDSNIIRNQIERISTQCHLRVVGKAGNGHEAFAQYQALKPDLVTMDLTMPELDGMACIGKIIAHDPNALILVISATADKHSVIDAIDQGARGFLHKPFSEQELADAIAQILATRDA